MKMYFNGQLVAAGAATHKFSAYNLDQPTVSDEGNFNVGQYPGLTAWTGRARFSGETPIAVCKRISPIPVP